MMKSEIHDAILSGNGHLPVKSADGLVGTLADTGRRSQGGKEMVPVEFESGKKLWVDLDRFELGEDGSLFLPFKVKPILDGVRQEAAAQGTIPILEERVKVSKRKVKTGKIRVSKRVIEKKEVIDEPGYQEEVDVQRVPINRIVDKPPIVRQEGETTVIPVMEEVLVVEKRLMLKEEVRVTVRRKQTRHSQEVTLRREEPLIEPLDADAPSAAGDETTSQPDEPLSARLRKHK